MIQREAKIALKTVLDIKGAGSVNFLFLVKSTISKYRV